MKASTRGYSVHFAAASIALAGALAAGCVLGPGEQGSSADSELVTGACSFGVTQNNYDGPNYWGTLGIKNTTTSSVTGFSVEFDAPSGAHCTNDAVPAGATLSPLSGTGTSAATTSNHCKFTWASSTLAAGATKTFNYSTDSSSFSAASNVVAGATTCGGTTSGGSTGGTTTTGGAGNFPARFAAPYVETWNDNDLANLANTTGHKFYTLAFVINGGGTCNPTWNGDTSLTGNKYGTYINGLRSLGGDVIVSFGGADGTELGRACGTVSSLQAAYQKVISQFHLTWIDLDIESGAESDATSIDRRNKAIHNLQVANPSLRVSYTLAVDRSGLPSAQINLLKNAKANGARVDVVNIMAMDYGPCYTDMGQAAIDAASSTQKQLASIGLAADVGVTPMIGTNDVTCEKFTTTNATQLVSYAQANTIVRTLGFWALGADPNHAYLKIVHPFH